MHQRARFHRPSSRHPFRRGRRWKDPHDKERRIEGCICLPHAASYVSSAWGWHVPQYRMKLGRIWSISFKESSVQICCHIGVKNYYPSIDHPDLKCMDHTRSFNAKLITLVPGIENLSALLYDSRGNQDRRDEPGRYYLHRWTCWGCARALTDVEYMDIYLWKSSIA
jgi:hypothetical protein